MKVGQPRSIINLYDWLPGYGESEVRAAMEGADLRLSVLYEKEVDDDLRIMKIDLIFVRARMFLKQSFPGGWMFESIAAENLIELGHVSEYVVSDFVQRFLEKQRAAFHYAPTDVRHFNVQFLYENIEFHILASDVLVGEELPAALS
ncbi:hypothetical protein L2Y96_19060 [Luteibacter aegosomaticola]|uniref:hypothetical protein n=1 Tax=Luteibacter aegosomaticola TaxID=2911538 RepID=UPI001FF872B9|nr:hypothetical protein [Luteibacter aegosomaticola]UPG89472.1 hypothetical protein L2Y96_19060 [Luteibacter aegosomaticola]